MTRVDPTVCENCGAPVAFDSSVTGRTCGGLSLRGWLVCSGCGGVTLSYRAKPLETWRVVASGRSLDVGITRLRPEKFDGDPRELLARIARVPAFEIALERIARGNLSTAEMAALARLALAGASAVALSTPALALKNAPEGKGL